MLKDIRSLAIDLQKKFIDIQEWPELAFDHQDRELLKTLENVQKVHGHSIQFRFNEKHCIVPSQYLLYAICVKELALALKEHTDVYERFKTGKSTSQIGEAITNGTGKLANLSLDAFSHSIGLKLFTDRDWNLGAKSIINGTAPNYKVRGTSDFYQSVILQVINVPNASSNVLGILINDLSDKRKIYSHFEKKYLSLLPQIVKVDTRKLFVRKVISFLYQYDGLSNLNPYISVNEDVSLKSIRFDDHKLTSIFKVSSSLLGQSELTQGNKVRFFEEPEFQDEEGNFIYVSTEWTDGTQSRLDIETFETVLTALYPEFEIIRQESTYSLRARNQHSDLESSVADLTLKDFNCNSFHSALLQAPLSIDQKFSNRFVASLLAKRFLILTGLSGSGKTKLAQAFVRWISANESQYVILPVASDWTNREPLFGYPNALNNTEYVKPESGVLDLILEAQKNENLPHFLILDEMNLSHVERYFADFLSGIESDERIPLHQSDTIEEVPKHVCLPKNLFVIGTVNIDETTYMFSPKVLDRANVIEFRISGDEIEKFLNNPVKPKLEHLDMKGASMGTSFAKLASATELPFSATEELNESLMSFFNQLKLSGAEFGYRAAHEIHRLAGALQQLDKSISVDNVIDICIMQKLLPKVHGSRKKMVDVLKQMATLCVEPNFDIEKLLDTKQYIEPSEVKYTLSLEKLHRMYRGAMENGFTSYAEA